MSFNERGVLENIGLMDYIKICLHVTPSTGKDGLKNNAC